MPVPSLPMHLDRSVRTPLAAQLAEQVRQLITRGALGAGQRLPSTRALAKDLGTSRSIAEQAYDQLHAEGWVHTRRGAGTFVATVTRPRSISPRPTAAHPGRATVVLDGGAARFDPRQDADWRRAWREVSSADPPTGYPDPAGLPELREELCRHLGRTRGLDLHPDDMVITSGTTDGWRQLLAVLPAGPVAIEDPGYRAAVHIARGAGREIIDLPVDRDGPRVGDLTDDARAVYLTPAHQHPLGTTMDASARHAVIAWARRTGGLVVEDDYDSEFCYDVAPQPALASLDRERTVFLGTASKSVSAALRLGWMVAPRPVLDAVVEHRVRTHDLPAWPGQLAFRAMLRDGHVSRATRSARVIYAERCALLRERFAQAGVDALLPDQIIGMYVALELPATVTRRLLEVTNTAGFHLPSLDSYARSSSRHGVVLGFGSCTEAELVEVIDLMLPVLTRAGRGSRSTAIPSS